MGRFLLSQPAIRTRINEVDRTIEPLQRKTAMRRIPKKLVTGMLLTIYGGIAVLGYGLHELVPEDGHHHHHLTFAAAGQASSETAFRAGGGVDDDHDCDICVFLDQARSVQPQIQAAIIWQHLVAAVEIKAPRLNSQTIEFCFAPRGPPALLG
jgi:hypothetical protein